MNVIKHYEIRETTSNRVQPFLKLPRSLPRDFPSMPSIPAPWYECRAPRVREAHRPKIPAASPSAAESSLRPEPPEDFQSDIRSVVAPLKNSTQPLRRRLHRPAMRRPPHSPPMPMPNIARKIRNVVKFGANPQSRLDHGKNRRRLPSAVRALPYRSASKPKSSAPKGRVASVAHRGQHDVFLGYAELMGQRYRREI